VAPLVCSSGKYVYSGQPFDLRVTVRNAADATTVNYDGRAKTLMAPVTLQGLAPADDKIVSPPAAPAGSRLTDGSSAQTTVKEVALDKFLLGVATQSVAYRFPGAYAMPAGAIALAAPTDVRFRASSTYASDDVVSSGPAAPKTEGELTVLTGRVMVPNSYGSERLPIRLPVQVQYWNSGWLGNVSDSVTQFGSAGVALANCSKGLTSGAGACNGVAKVQDGTYVFKQGVLPPPKGQLVLLAPGVAGSVDVSVSGLPYLPSTQGRAVFGVFKSGPVIYLREMY
jgi:MSHA biogenesis protein MshQ